MLNCQQLSEQVTDHLEKRQPLAQRLAFLFHLRICPGCRQYLRNVRKTIQILTSLPVADLSQAQQSTADAAFSQWLKSRA